MKTLLKILGGLVVLVLAVAACGYGYLMFAYPKVPPPTAFKIEPTPERLARGKYLSDHVVGCTACHSKRDWTKFSGPIDPDTLGMGGDEFQLGPAGVLYAKNITPAAIGSWTDGELLRAVTQGVSQDGTPLFPLMPYPHFGALDEEDIHAVLAYVRSWKAIENTPKPRQLTQSAANDTHPRWSVDGTNIYFLSARTGSTQIWRLPMNGGEAVQISDYPLDVGSFKFSSGGGRLALGLTGTLAYDLSARASIVLEASAPAELLKRDGKTSIVLLPAGWLGVAVRL